MTTLADIEALARAYADARRRLADAVAELEEEIRRLRRARLPKLRRLLDTAAEARSRRHAAVESAPELFRRPRTVVFHGIKVGWQKGKGELQWEDGARVVELIRRHLPDRFDELVKTVHRPLRTALAKLSVDQLRKIGVTVIENGDRVIIVAQDGEIEKLIDRLLEDAAREDGR